PQKFRGPTPEMKVGPPPQRDLHALGSWLNVSDANHAGRLVERPIDSHLFALELSRFGLVIELIRHGVSLENVVLSHLNHGSRERILGLGVRHRAGGWLGLG